MKSDADEKTSDDNENAETMNIVSLAAARRKLRPPPPGSLAATLKAIDEAFGRG